MATPIQGQIESHYTVRVLTPTGESSTGNITVISWDPAGRRKRAFKMWGYCWAGALFAVILPLIHFVLVPALILAGPGVAFWIFHQESVISGGSATCPRCKQEFAIARHPAKNPFDELCNHCQTAVKIEWNN